LIIYLDESGDLGFDFNQTNTSRYFIIGLLIFWDDAAHSAMIRAVKRTLKNKLPNNTYELKGSHLSLPIKQYFLKEINEEKNWCLYAAIADKKTWIKHHLKNHYREPKKQVLYDEVAKRLFSQLEHLEVTQHINVVVDRCKKTRLTIKHRRSQEDAGLQAIDIFCAGIWRKYEKADLSWYQIFSDRVASEIEYKF
jgi:hypothetical protein